MGKELAYIFLQRKIYRWAINMKRCSASLVISNQNHNEIQLHTHQDGYYLKTQTTENKCWGECEDIGTLVHCWWEYKILQLL